MTKIELGKEYVTRRGEKVRIYATDAGGYRPVHGAIRRDDGNWHVCFWRDDGSWHEHPYTGSDDLVEVKPRFRLERWVSLWRSGDGKMQCGSPHVSARVASEMVPGAIARIKIIVEGEEGQFDD